MSRWSARNESADRGGVLPVPALIAAAVVCVAISLFATTLQEREPTRERTLVEPAADDAVERASDAGLVAPSRLEAALDSLPDGYRGNLSVRVGGRRWAAGPTPPDDAAAGERVVSVRADRGRVRPGTFRTVIWT